MSLYHYNAYIIRLLIKRSKRPEKLFSDIISIEATDRYETNIIMRKPKYQ